MFGDVHICVRQIVDAGACVEDHSAEAFMMNQVMGRAYLKRGTADVRSSLNASLCIALVETTACAVFQHALVQGIWKAAVILTAWLTTRRTAESAYISWDCTFYEPTFACAYIAIYQSKVDEEKLIPLVAGECMWLCW